MKICADIGGSFVDIAILTDDALITDRYKYDTPTDDWSALVDIFRAVQDRHGPALRPRDPVSIALAGFVDAATGVTTSANIECVSGRAMARDLGAALGRSVFVSNDADCFALAEAKLGSARGHKRVFGIILGTGVGGGLVQDGRLVVGDAGVSGEWGHGPVITRSRSDPKATPYFRCGCGQWGCLDTVGAARGMERLHDYLHGVEVHSRNITQAWGDGDPAATETIDFYMELVSGPLAAILNTYNATIVPVGGGLSNSRPLVRELDIQVRQRMLRPPNGPILVATSLGGDAGLLGAGLAADV